MNFLETYYTDVYKTGHKPMLPTGSSLMSSNMTPRSGAHSNVPNSKGVISIGQQKVVRQMKEDWDVNFFQRPVEEIDQFGKDLTMMLMLDKPFDVTHFKELHALGYLPLKIKSIQEGTFIPYKIPLYTIVNTKPLNGVVVDWLVNYLETILSSEGWMMPTSATLGLAYRRLGKEWLEKTDPGNMWFLDYQFHDFSMRGMPGKSALVSSGLGFASTSRGSDTLPVIPAARKYYDEPLNETVINSVIATEHAIMCSLTGFFLQQKDGSWENVGDFEVETFRYLLKKFPTGILSLVSDTWNLWRVITEYCVILKDEILARDGKLVIRPDSGDPVDIICGTGFKEDSDGIEYLGQATLEEEFPRWKGVIELLWEIFGGITNEQGYKVLDSHIGAIYGDAITLERAGNIFQRLADKGFASSNITLGVGSFSMTYVTRDTHGFAQKATYIELTEKVPEAGYDDIIHDIEIFKDPVTDNGIKKSAKGLLQVWNNNPKCQGCDLLYDGNDRIMLKDQCTWEEEAGGLLQTIFKDGKFFNQTTFTEIRERINKIV